MLNLWDFSVLNNSNGALACLNYFSCNPRTVHVLHQFQQSLRLDTIFSLLAYSTFYFSILFHSILSKYLYMNHKAWQKFTHIIEEHAPYSFRVYHENGGSIGLYSITSPKTVIFTISAMKTSNLTVWIPLECVCLYIYTHMYKQECIHIVCILQR